jgi:hypothetical protein
MKVAETAVGPFKTCQFGLHSCPPIGEAERTHSTNWFYLKLFKINVLIVNAINFSKTATSAGPFHRVCWQKGGSAEPDPR